MRLLRRALNALKKPDISYVGRQSTQDQDRQKGGRRAQRWFYRSGPDKGSTSRQFFRRKLWLMAFNSVNKADAKRCHGVHREEFAVPQTRQERRKLARAYFELAWLKRAAVKTK